MSLLLRDGAKMGHKANHGAGGRSVVVARSVWPTLLFCVGEYLGRAIRVLANEGYKHEYISGYSSPEPGHVTLPGPHRAASLLKRWNAGTTTASSVSTCGTISTSSPSGSTGADPRPAGCCPSDSCSKASIPTRIP